MTGIARDRPYLVGGHDAGTRQEINALFNEPTHVVRGSMFRSEERWALHPYGLPPPIEPPSIDLLAQRRHVTVAIHGRHFGPNNLTGLRPNDQGD